MIFLSEAAKALHREYLRNLRMKFSIYEKSYPVLKNKSCKELLSVRIKRDERERALALKCEIMAHELYFSSFGISNARCEAVHNEYGSEANFLYRLYLDSREVCEGFLVIYRDRNQRLNHIVGRNYFKAFVDGLPLLAVDMSEHSYFLDYYFAKETYIKAALSRLDLSKIQNLIEK